MHGRSIRRIVRRFGSFEQLREWDKLDDREDISRFDEIFEHRNEVKIPQRISLPEEFVTLTGKTHPLSATHAIKYLEKREVTKEDLSLIHI